MYIFSYISFILQINIFIELFKIKNKNNIYLKNNL